MRITTIDELAAYLRTEIVRINAEQGESAGDVSGDGSALSRTVHLDGQLAAVQKTLAMVTDDAYADVARDAVSFDDRLRPGGAGMRSEGYEGAKKAAPAGVAVAPEWPGG